MLVVKVIFSLQELQEFRSLADNRLEALRPVLTMSIHVNSSATWLRCSSKNANSFFKTTMAANFFRIRLDKQPICRHYYIHGCSVPNWRTSLFSFTWT